MCHLSSTPRTTTSPTKENLQNQKGILLHLAAQEGVLSWRCWNLSAQERSGARQGIHRRSSEGSRRTIVVLQCQWTPLCLQQRRGARYWQCATPETMVASSSQLCLLLMFSVSRLVRCFRERDHFLLGLHGILLGPRTRRNEGSSPGSTTPRQQCPFCTPCWRAERRRSGGGGGGGWGVIPYLGILLLRIMNHTIKGAPSALPFRFMCVSRDRHAGSWVCTRARSLILY